MGTATEPGGSPESPISLPPPAASHDQWLQLITEAREAEEAAGTSHAANHGLHTQPVGEPPTPWRENITTAPIGELRVDLSLPGRQVALRHGTSVSRDATTDRASDGFCVYRTLRHYLDTPKPSPPSEKAVKVMTHKQRATIRQLTEQSREWVIGLLAKIEEAEDGKD